MGYWVWRPLVFCVSVSVLVAGCTITTESAATGSAATAAPEVTLTIRQRETNPPPTPRVVALANTAQVTDTPQASPTPMIYIVQEGDTLLGIALDFGVDLAVLQNANGGIDPRVLQIGQELVIPDPQNDASGNPLMPDVSPVPLPLDAPKCYRTPVDRVLCLGVVDNVTENMLERIAVLVQVFDDSDNLLGENVASLEQMVLPAGESAPYRVQFDVEWEDYAGAAVLLRSADIAVQPEERFVPLEVREVETTRDNGRFVVDLTVHNTSEVTASAPRVVVTLTNVDDEVVGYRVVQAEEPLNAGDDLPLHIELFPQTNDTNLSYNVHVEARRDVAADE